MNFRVRIFQAAVATSAAVLLAACAGLAAREPAAATGRVELRILALNDFHGNLEAPLGGVRVPDPDNPGAFLFPPGGGAPRLATLAADRRAQSPNTIMVAAGDMIGASPILSGLFHDEPTIESLSMMGLDLSAVGNHEFDEGVEELHRMQAGGCHPADGCTGPGEFEGAGFRYLAAGAVIDATGETVFPAHDVREFDGVKVGFIGLTLKGTPALIAPAAAAGLTFQDEVETINAETAKLRAQGVEAIVVLLHEGGYPAQGPGDCPGLSGPIAEIVPRLDRAVDVIVTGHTHSTYVCRVDDRLVTSAGRYGTMLTEIMVTLDRATGDVVQTQAETLYVLADALAEDAAQVELIGAYRTLAAPMMNRVAGSLAAPLTNAKDAAGESPMGLVIADAKLAAARASAGQVDLALMNPGGVRSDIPKTGDVTFADLYAVQPFGNDIVVLTLTGAQIEAVLAQQFRAGGNPMILHVSDGFAFHWRQTADGGALVAGSATLNGEALESGRDYRVATNNFLASGGDSFSAFTTGRDLTIAGNDVAALEAYIRDRSPLSPPAGGRVVVE